MQHFKKDEWDTEDFIWHEHDIKKGFARPVIVHRAILGSVERFMAILIEHLAGKFPYFISPRQVLICNLSEKYNDYCVKVYKRLHKEGIRVELNLSNETLNKKIRNGQLDQFNYIVVCGDQEEQSGTVDIRTREGGR
jgi:threonyl-tRNA synthetase